MKTYRKKQPPRRRPRKLNAPLTAREIEVLQCRTRMTGPQVAKQLGVTVATVYEHIKSVREKFGIGDIAILLLEAHKRGLITY